MPSAKAGATSAKLQPDDVALATLLRVTSLTGETHQHGAAGRSGRQQQPPRDIAAQAPRHTASVALESRVFDYLVDSDNVLELHARSIKMLM